MTVFPVNALSLKKVKNSIIGNPSAKKQLAQDVIFIQTLITCLHPLHAFSAYQDPSDAHARGYDESLRIEAAHVIASLAGSEEALGTLLDYDVLRTFLLAISCLQPTDSVSLRSAITRGLRAITIAMAEIVGPPQWGLKTTQSKVQNRARDGLDFLFQVESLDVYLPLLVDTSPQISLSIAQIIASALRRSEHRKTVTEWLPREDRAKEAKASRRGWEKASVVNVNAPSRQGGWLARHLTGLLTTRDSKLQEAVLLALAALAKDNTAISSILARPDRDHPSILSSIVPLIKSRNVDVQLAAALCAAHIMRGSAPSAAHPLDESHMRAVINFFNSIISSPVTETSLRRTKACFILYYMIVDDSVLCDAAYGRGCLEKLVALVQETTQEESRVEWGEDEAESVSLLREAALTAIAAMALFDDHIRRTITEDLRLIPTIHTCLFHQHSGVRYAACQCVRALSRAVTVLRTNIVDSGLGMTILSIFKKKDEDSNVTNAALSAVCNIVIDFSPLRPIYLEQGLMERLLELLETGDLALKLNGLWVVKNLLRKSTSETKRSVMCQLGWDRIIEYLQDDSVEVQEQMFNVLRNLAENMEGIDLIFKNINSEILLTHTTTALTSSSEDVILQAVSLVANLINGTEQQQNEIVTHPQLLEGLRSCLADGKADIKKPATSCIYQLARRNPKARRAIIDAGVVSTLRHLCEWSGSTMSPTTVTSPISASGFSVGGTGMSVGSSARGISPGGRNWGSTVGIAASHSHSHIVGSGHWSQAAQPVPGIFQPHSIHSHATVMEDDKDVVHNARAALDWLERGDVYA